MPDRAQRILKDVFGYDAFRGQQAGIIDCVAQGQNAMVLMPTGGGKSLCYQIPALLREGVGIVVSPLIALMEDQVATLGELGIAAVALNSTLDAAAQREVARRLRQGEIRLLYLAPERLLQERMLAFLQTLPIALFAIDEAHCVSQWGHDFRPEYMQLGQLATLFPQVPRIALTATADQRTRDEIASRLQLEGARWFRSSFDRPNIFYRIAPKEQPRQQLMAFLATQKGESGIVYCMSRKKVDALADYLNGQGLLALPYHAGLPAEVRMANQRRFLNEEGVIMVATIAFGMGIDKPNVRFVAHLDLPKSLEAYYQETGRAGRDGLPATAWMVYGLQDVLFLRQMMAASEGDERYKRVERHKLEAMLGLCEETRCRRQALLAYFGEQRDAPCGHCDICVDGVETWDATEAARMALSAIYRSGQRYGVGHLLDILLGRDNDRVRTQGHQRLSVFGVGRHLGESDWRSVFRQLVIRGLVDVDVEGHGGLRLTETCRPLLRGEISLELRRDRRPAGQGKKYAPSAASQLIGPDERQCWEALRQLRRRLAQEHAVPPYAIFPDATLLEMLRNRPDSLQAMSRIAGVGERKLERYGTIFLQLLQEGAGEKPSALVNSAISLADRPCEAVALAGSGLSVLQIASQLQCTEDAVYRWLAEAISDQQLTVEQVVSLPPGVLEQIQDLFLESDGALPSVAMVAGQLEPAVPVGVLACIRAALQLEFDS